MPTNVERPAGTGGPKALALAGERTTGAHPYLVTPEHTGMARRLLGSDRLLAPEQKVVLAEDPTTARQIARGGIGMYLRLTNYLANLRRLGFDDEDFAAGGSDRFVDALVAWGTLEQVKSRIDEHLAAGADHVSVQLLSAEETPPGQPSRLPVEEYRRLGEALTG